MTSGGNRFKLRFMLWRKTSEGPSLLPQNAALIRQIDAVIHLSVYPYTLQKPNEIDLIPALPHRLLDIKNKSIGNKTNFVTLTFTGTESMQVWTNLAKGPI